jgi:hypothetical protein
LKDNDQISKTRHAITNRGYRTPEAQDFARVPNDSIPQALSYFLAVRDPRNRPGGLLRAAAAVSFLARLIHHFRDVRPYRVRDS